MSRPRERTRLEDGLKLDINQLIRLKLLCPGKAWEKAIRWSSGFSGQHIATGKISADMTDCMRGWLRLEIGSLDQYIALEAIPRHFGGRQWYFICPNTGRRISVLWRTPGAHTFSCRQTWGRRVAYGSQFQTASDRAISAAQAIRERLGGRDWISLFDPFPPKPKGQRWQTYLQLSDRCATYESISMHHLRAFIERMQRRG